MELIEQIREKLREEAAFASKHWRYADMGEVSPRQWHMQYWQSRLEFITKLEEWLDEISRDKAAYGE